MLTLVFDYHDITDNRKYILDQIDNLDNYEVIYMTSANNNNYQDIFISKKYVSQSSIEFGLLTKGYIKDEYLDKILNIEIPENSICFSEIASKKLLNKNLSRTKNLISDNRLFMDDPLSLIQNNNLIENYENRINNFLNKETKSKLSKPLEIFIFENKEEILNYINGLKGLISIDVETNGDTGYRYITCLSLSTNTNQSFVIPQKLITNEILTLLSKKYILFHNSVYDLSYFNNIVKPENIEDTYIISKSMNNDGQHGLEKLTLKYLNNKQLWKKYNDK